MVLEMREFGLTQEMDLVTVLNLVIIQATSQILPILKYLLKLVYKSEQ